MNSKEKIEALQNGLRYFKFPEKYFVYTIAEGKKSNKFAIASKGEYGAINTHSRFMTYDEFNAYLFGYSAAKDNKF